MQSNINTPLCQNNGSKYSIHFELSIPETPIMVNGKEIPLEDTLKIEVVSNTGPGLSNRSHFYIINMESVPLFECNALFTDPPPSGERGCQRRVIAKNPEVDHTIKICQHQTSDVVEVKGIIVERIFHC